MGKQMSVCTTEAVVLMVRVSTTIVQPQDFVGHYAARNEAMAQLNYKVLQAQTKLNPNGTDYWGLERVFDTNDMVAGMWMGKQ